MNLYLVQHAKALSKEVDPERSLSDQGRREAHKVTMFIQPLGITVDYLWHSPKARAAQTADILAEAVAVRLERSVRADLGPNDDVSAFKSQLDSTDADIMVVGHMPFLGKLTSLLLAGDPSADMVAFTQAGVVALGRHDEGNWQLLWMITPQMVP